MGLSRDERFNINNSLQSSWKSSWNFPPPKFLKFGSFSFQPDVWIDPKESTILQIKAAELSQSSSYGTPFALRFPRIEAWRKDKIWNECMTLGDYEQFYKVNLTMNLFNEHI